MAGYPLPPKINLKTKSIYDAITALGPDVALATVNPDTFRAHFIEQGQKDILGLIERALKLKKADKVETGEEMETGDEMETGG